MTDNTRRAFLAGVGALAAAGALPRAAPASSKGTRAFRLEPGPASAALLAAPEPPTEVWAYGGSVPGPEIRLRQGERLAVEVANGLAQPTTVHWHGLRVPNAMDGVPELTQAPIEPGGSFRYEFDVPDAGTYWYHPHVLSSQQVGHGLYGPLIVEEAEPPQVDRDLVWVIDDWRLEEDASISQTFSNPHDMSHAGRLGNVTALNGRDSSTFSVRAGERLRLRLINCANARIFGLVLEGHRPLIIARDGQPVTPHDAEGPLVLGPGQRADLIVDMAGDPGQRYPVMDAYYQRQTYKFLDLVYNQEPPLRTSPLNASPALAPNALPEPDPASARKEKITISGGAMGSMASAHFRGADLPIRDLARQGKMWALNGIVADGMAMEPLLILNRGRGYVLAFENQTAWPHPMHLHGHAFRVLARDGRPEPHQPWSDTVLIAPRQSVEVAFVADNPGDWLLHCHVLEHHEAGMACVVKVA